MKHLTLPLFGLLGLLLGLAPAAVGATPQYQTCPCDLRFSYNGSNGMCAQSVDLGLPFYGACPFNPIAQDCVTPVLSCYVTGDVSTSPSFCCGNGNSVTLDVPCGDITTTTRCQGLWIYSLECADCNEEFDD